MTLIEAESRLGGIGAQFIAAAGRLYTERTTLHAYPVGATGECYRVAFGLAMKHPELTYCEGRALAMGIVPVGHAWCIDADGLVVDTVWDEYQTDYVGVAFSTAFMKRWTASRKVYGVLAGMFPPELAEMAPSAFLARPTLAQINAVADVLARVRKLIGRAA